MQTVQCDNNNYDHNHDGYDKYFVRYLIERSWLFAAECRSTIERARRAEVLWLASDDWGDSATAGRPVRMSVRPSDRQVRPFIKRTPRGAVRRVSIIHCLYFLFFPSINAHCRPRRQLLSAVCAFKRNKCPLDVLSSIPAAICCFSGLTFYSSDTSTLSDYGLMLFSWVSHNRL